MNTLVLVEHDNNSVNDATLAVVTAAAKLGDVTALVAGSNCGGAADAAAKIAGVSKVLKADDAAYGEGLAENVAPLAAAIMDGYDAFLAPATTSGKNIAPRVAALLDAATSTAVTAPPQPCGGGGFDEGGGFGVRIAARRSNEIGPTEPGSLQGPDGGHDVAISWGSGTR